MAKDLKLVEKLCLFLGGGKGAVYAAKGLPKPKKEALIGNAALVSSTIALAKAIFRPTFTMADKDEKPETKKYTAIREGLTEAIAIPIYILSGVAAKKLNSHLWNKGYFAKLAKKQLNTEKVTKDVVRKAHELEQKSDVNLGFLGVALSALIVIPALCSEAIKPMMGMIYKNSDDNIPKEFIEDESNLIAVSEAPDMPMPTPPVTYNYYSNSDGYKRLNSFPNTAMPVSGMKVGGV